MSNLNEESVVPQPGWILVQRKLPAKTTPGGLHIPEIAQTRNRGITPGETQSATVIATAPYDQDQARENSGNVYAADVGVVKLPAPGSVVFLLAQPDNLVPVWDSDWGLVERENGFAVPEYYLFKLSALAGTVKEAA